MKVTKKTESIYEVEFDRHELKSLQDIRELYEVSPELFIDMSLEQSLQQGIDGVARTIERVAKEMELEDGYENPPAI